MSDSGFQQAVIGVMAGTGKGELSAIIPAGPASDVVFTPFGIVNEDDAFNLGWTFKIKEGSTSAVARAFCSGSGRYQPAAGGRPARLILECIDPMGASIWKSEVPDWFPFPQFIIYTGLDEADIRRAVAGILEGNETLRGVLSIQLGGPQRSPAQIAELFTSGGLQRGFPFNSGDPIGKGASSGASADRIFSVAFQDKLDNPENAFLDPAVFHEHWSSYVKGMTGHPFAAAFRSPFGALRANGRVHFVKADFKSRDAGADGSTPPFTPMKPAMRPDLAVEKAAGPHDTVVILDDSTYVWRQIDIKQPMSLVGLSKRDALRGSEPMPIIDGARFARVIRVESVDGVVSLANVALTNGVMTNESAAREQDAFNAANPAPVPKRMLAAGGGLAIYHSDRTYVRNCRVFGNTVDTTHPPHPEAAGWLLGNTEHGFGGGIFITGSDAYVYRCLVTGNDSACRGGGIGIWGLGWPMIEGCVIDHNRAWGGRPDGGGIGIEILGATSFQGNGPPGYEAAFRRQVVLKGNFIQDNAASDDGGGVYMSVLSRVKFLGNTIVRNHAGGDGGGLRVSMSSMASMWGDTVSDNTSGASASATHPSGGGIAVHNASAELFGVKIERNESLAGEGGGISFVSTRDNGTPDWDAIERQTFRTESVRLRLDADCVVRGNKCILAAGKPDHALGGGIFARRVAAPDFVTFPVKIEILSLANVSGNQLMPVGSTFAAPNAKQVFIDDAVNRVGSPLDDVSAPAFASAGRLTYDSP